MMMLLINKLIRKYTLYIRLLIKNLTFFKIYLFFYVCFFRNVPCNDAPIFCGLKDRLYPDRRAMGFPFDRPHSVDSIRDYANLTSNMVLGECSIRFTNTIINRS